MTVINNYLGFLDSTPLVDEDSRRRLTGDDSLPGSSIGSTLEVVLRAAKNSSGVGVLLDSGLKNKASNSM